MNKAGFTWHFPGAMPKAKKKPEELVQVKATTEIRMATLTEVAKTMADEYDVDISAVWMREWNCWYIDFGEKCVSDFSKSSGRHVYRYPEEGDVLVEFENGTWKVMTRQHLNSYLRKLAKKTAAEAQEEGGETCT